MKSLYARVWQSGQQREDAVVTWIVRYCHRRPHSAHDGQPSASRTPTRVDNFMAPSTSSRIEPMGNERLVWPSCLSASDLALGLGERAPEILGSSILPGASAMRPRADLRNVERDLFRLPFGSRTLPPWSCRSPTSFRCSWALGEDPTTEFVIQAYCGWPKNGNARAACPARRPVVADA